MNDDRNRQWTYLHLPHIASIPGKAISVNYQNIFRNKKEVEKTDPVPRGYIQVSICVGVSVSVSHSNFS